MGMFVAAGHLRKREYWVLCKNLQLDSGKAAPARLGVAVVEIGRVPGGRVFKAVVQERF